MKTLRFAIALAAAAALFAQSLEVELQRATQKEMVNGDLRAVIAEYKKIAARAGSNHAVAVKALMRAADCYQKLGDAESRKIYEQIVSEYGDQKEAVATARAHLGRTETARGTGVSFRHAWTLPPGGDFFGAVSPDGHSVPYVDWDHRGDLVLHDLVTGADRQLTNTAGDTPGGTGEFAEEWAFSRDGKQLAYSWFHPKNRFDVRLIDLRGSGIPQPKRLFHDDDMRWVGPADWSPDGKWLAVGLRRNNGMGQVGLISVQDGSLRVLKSLDRALVPSLSFSPDGNYLAFDFPVGNTTQHDISILAVDGSHENPVVVYASNDRLIGWSPDGQRLLFSSDRAGAPGLWSLMIRDGKPQGEPELMKEGIDLSERMGITVSGSIYAAVWHRRRSNTRVASIDIATGRFLSPPVDGVQEFVGTNESPDWSPDGKYLTYISRRRGGIFIGIRSLETGQTRDLRPQLENFTAPRWSPDGTAFLAWGRDLKRRDGIYRIDAQTGEVSLVVAAPSQPGEGISWPQWSPDGKGIYYRRNFPGGKEVAFVDRDLASGKEQEVIRRPFLGAVNFSPDGRYIATGSVDPASNSRTQLLIPARGGEPRELMRMPAEVAPAELLDFTKGLRMDVIGWARDSRSVFLRKQVSDAKEPDEIWQAPIDGSAPRKLDLKFNRNETGIRIHPDGRQIAFMVQDQERPKPGEVWVLENILPRAK